MGEQSRADDGRYYAKDGMVWKSPVRRKMPDGVTKITIGFPVCSMHDAVGEEAAATVAELMNRGDRHDELVAELGQLNRAYVRLLEAGRDRIISAGGTCDPVDMMESGDPALRSARAALARATTPDPDPHTEAPGGRREG